VAVMKNMVPGAALAADRRQISRMSPGARNRLASYGAWAAGLVILLGSILDLSILWFLQRQNGPQWEYVAFANSIESMPRVLIGLGFIGLALYLRDAGSMIGFRIIGAVLLMFGILSITAGFLMVTSYYALVQNVTEPQAYVMLRSVAIKAVALSGLYACVLVPLGIMSLQRPRQ
jgi:hypothetical protein